MREISVYDISQTVKRLYLHCSVNLPNDVVRALENALLHEPSSIARQQLQLSLQNIDIASDSKMPLCQDTGLCTVWVRLGQEVHIIGGNLNEAIQAGIAEATVYGHLRRSVRDPYSGQNTLTNTPVPIHVSIESGDICHITVAPKGAGSENKGAIAMLDPVAGIDGIMDFVVKTVEKAGGSPCPPIIVGVGIGGNMETCAMLAKKALLRDIDDDHKFDHWATFERTCRDLINALGIGPQGFGGRTTALCVHVEAAPTHIACLPVAVAIQCHIARHASEEI